MASHPSHEDKPSEQRRAVQKSAGTKQKWPHETQSFTYASSVVTPSYLLCIVMLLPPSFLCCPRSPSHHPSNLTLVCASVVYLYSTDFCHQHSSSHMVLIHSFHVSKPSQYSLIHSTCQLLSIPVLLCTSSLLTLSIGDTSTKLLKHFMSRTFTFLLSGN